MVAHSTVDISAENTTLGDLAGKIMIPALIVGVIGLAAAAAFGLFGDAEARSRFFQGYLVAFLFCNAIALGGLFFVLIHHATRAGWSVVVRRIAEGFTGSFILLFVLFLPLLWALFDPSIELWQWATKYADDAVIQHKAPYLNTTFFVIRLLIYFGVWIGMSEFFFRNSVRQDSTGDESLSRRMAATSPPGLILFGLTLTFASFDWLMSQEAHWFSTIFGVYYFAGVVTSFMSLAILSCLFLQRTGRLANSITAEHYHDLGKLLFAFGMVFWAYIAYSQYMLQWYGNLPEETVWWQARASGVPAEQAAEEHLGYVPGAWNAWSFFLLAAHFMIPFVAIISRVPKRRKVFLGIAAAWMLFMGWFDLFWLVMPIFHPESAAFALTDFLTLVGFVGLFVGFVALRLRNLALVPLRDPRLDESLAFENV